MSRIENNKSQMRKGMLEYCVLLLLSRGPLYTSEIMARLKTAHLIVVEGTLYPLLSRLKKEGLLSYHWEESPCGPPRKYYTLSDEGRENLAQLDECWNELAHTVSAIRSINP